MGMTTDAVSLKTLSRLCGTRDGGGARGTNGRPKVGVHFKRGYARSSQFAIEGKTNKNNYFYPTHGTGPSGQNLIPRCGSGPGGVSGKETHAMSTLFCGYTNV